MWALITGSGAAFSNKHKDEMRGQWMILPEEKDSDSNVLASHRTRSGGDGSWRV